MEINAQEFDELQLELERKYNEICQAAMVKIYRRTIFSNDSEIIPIKGINLKDAEHLFILSTAKAIGGVFSAQVALKVPAWRRWRLNRKIKIKGSKYLPYKEEYDEYAIDPKEILAELREWAEELVGPDFTFDDIYYEFYA